MTDGRRTDVQPIAKTCFSIADGRKNRQLLQAASSLIIKIGLKALNIALLYIEICVFLVETTAAENCGFGIRRF